MKKVSIYNLDRKTFSRLKKLCHEPTRGYLAMYLEVCWLAANKYKKNDFLCDIYIEQSGGKILGWAMVQDLLYRYDVYADFGIFVDPQERRKGVASKLLEAALNDEGQLRPLAVWIGDNVNKGFYQRYNNRVACFDMEHWVLTGEYKRFEF